jgi:hypothetical protein
VSVEQSAWTGPPEADDDANFIAIVDGLLDRLAAADEAVDVHVVRIDNWFGPKWLGFAGKVLGALGIHQDATRADLVVPPFTPGRVIWERRFARNADGQRFVVEAAPTLHRSQTSSSNLHRKLAAFSDRAHFVWFSGKSRSNGRGSVMVASLRGEDQNAYYVGFTRKQDGWEVGDESGDPLFPAALLTEGTGEGQ